MTRNECEFITRAVNKKPRIRFTFRTHRIQFLINSLLQSPESTHSHFEWFVVCLLLSFECEVHGVFTNKILLVFYLDLFNIWWSLHEGINLIRHCVTVVLTMSLYQKTVKKTLLHWAYKSGEKCKQHRTHFRWYSRKYYLWNNEEGIC